MAGVAESTACATYFGRMSENGEGASAGVQHFHRLWGSPLHPAGPAR
jgi:hypothetical protein